MIMKAILSLPRPPARCWSALLFAAPLCFAASPAGAQWYGDQRSDARAGEFAAQFDPSDPVPEIGRDDGRGGCRDERDGCRQAEHRRGHDEERLRLSDRNALMVDCSRQHRNMFPSVDAAVHRAPPNATILILPPGDGTTCVETVTIHKPLTISTLGGGSPAVIQAPADQPCLIADIPLGDTLTIDRIRFIARGHKEPCVSVQAGHVVVRNSSIDSRTRNWAFDVAESGDLSVEATHIETDGSGVHARRAQVELRDLAIDIDIGHDGVGLALDRTDGTVEGGSIVGGSVGILASAGTHGLQLSDTKVHKAKTGVALLSGGLGSISADRLALSNNADGLVIGPGAESQITRSVITDSAEDGIAIYGAGTLVSGNKIVGAETGIRLSPPGAFSPPTSVDFMADPPADGNDGKPIVENNLVANVRHAAVAIDGPARGRVMGNVFYAPGHARCIAGDGRVEERDNACHDSWLPWPF
jgi:hypothetical protein